MSKHLGFMAVGVSVTALALVFTSPAMAEINQGTHLNTSGQSKVHSAMARGYQKSGDTDGYSKIQKQSQVNIGSKKAGTCNMNVGSTEAGQKNSKDVIVTSKNIINVCK